MSAITIKLPSERLTKLQETATHFGVTVEELVRLSVEELLSRPDQVFEEAMARVLEKNEELYQRLA